jgi:hypothetical protein
MTLLQRLLIQRSFASSPKRWEYVNVFAVLFQNLVDRSMIAVELPRPGLHTHRGLRACHRKFEQPTGCVGVARQSKGEETQEGPWLRVTQRKGGLGIDCLHH